MFNPRGNRELKAIVKLHDRILERNGGSWWRPPATVTISADDREARDAVLATIPGDPVALKDPRMLLVTDLWRELEPMWIGVIRNPVAVRRSLERREQKHGRQPLDSAGWEGLWRRYNRLLLAELERERFPVVDFDRGDELDTQVRAVLAHYGIEPPGGGGFFEPDLVRERVDVGWRDEVLSPESIELWERLVAFS
jgi:hypothetical protein